MRIALQGVEFNDGNGLREFIRDLRQFIINLFSQLIENFCNFSASQRRRRNKTKKVEETISKVGKKEIEK